MFKFSYSVAQILNKELQMIFRSSDVSISYGNIKDTIRTSTFTLNFTFKVFHVSVAVAKNWKSKILFVMP